MKKITIILLLMYLCTGVLNAKDFKLGVIGIVSPGNSKDPGLVLISGTDPIFKETNWNINLYGGVIEFPILKKVPIISRFQLGYGKKDKILHPKHTSLAGETNLQLLLLDISLIYRQDLYKASSLDLGFTLDMSEEKYTDKIIYFFETRSDNKIINNYTFAPSMNFNLRLTKKLYFRLGVLYRLPQTELKIVRFVEDAQSIPDRSKIYAKTEISNIQIMSALLISL